MPRPITSHVCAPSISSQTRTHRVHKNATIMINYKTIMRGINLFFRISIRKVNVRDAQLLCHGLQFAMTIQNTSPNRCGCVH